MDKPGISHLSNHHLKAMLFRRENIEPLEDLLAAEQKRLAELENLKASGMLELGNKLTSDELEASALEVMGEANRFLGVEGIKPPRIYKSSTFAFGYLSGLLLVPGLILSNTDVMLAGISAIGCAHMFYQSVKGGAYIPKFKSITVPNTGKTDAIPILGHEYAHHVQVSTCKVPKLILCRYDMFIEGFAYGAERDISQFFAEKEDNPAFLYKAIERAERSIQSAYRKLTRGLGVEPKKSLLNKPENFLSGLPIGNAIFLLAAHMQGEQVYRNALRGEFAL